MENNSIVREKIESLLNGIQGKYGSELTDELLSRLENTISDFNDEVEQLMNELKENASKKAQLMADIKSGKTKEKTDVPETDSDEEVKDISEWEKRLESLS